MKINDEGLIIGQKKYGEDALIINIFSKSNGPIMGLTKISKKNNKALLLDNVTFNWKSRISDGLGYLNFEIINNYYSINEPYILNLIKVSISEVCLKLIPLKDSNSHIYINIIQILELFKKKKLNNLEYAKYFIIWELDFIANLGYEVDFTKCSVSGVKDNLVYLSPKSGNVVSREVGEPWKEKLLNIPAFIINKESNFKKEDIINGLLVTEFFFNRIIKSIFDNRKSKKLIFKKQLIDFIDRVKGL